MRRRLATVALTVVLALSLSGTVARAQTSLPPDIRAITQKAKAGQELTEAEEQRLEEWLEGQQQVAPSKRAPGPAGAVGTAESAAGHPAVCPSGQPATLPANAPTPGEYTKLLNALAATHGPRAGETRGDVDRVFAARSASAAGSEVGALLHVAGADEASVYASATAARQRPFDPVLANNLGVALTALGNHRAAAQVLLYAGRLQPGAALVELNLGWAYFGAGQLASAEKQFQRALSLNRNLAGAQGGLGVVAACRGDHAAAMRLLKESMAKRNSAVFAGVYRQAKSRVQDTKKAGEPGKDDPAPPPADAKLIPDLPISEDPDRTRGALAAVQQLRQEADDRLGQLREDHDRLLALVRKLNERDKRDPGSAMVFRRVFEGEILQFSEATELAFGRRIQEGLRPVGPGTRAMQTANADMAQRAANANAQAVPLQRQIHETLLAEGECHRRFPALENPSLAEAALACIAPHRARRKELEKEIAKIFEPLCEVIRQARNVSFAQQYKIWRSYANAVRTGADDLYAFTDPILERIYAPALNEYLANYRETMVTGAYRQVLTGAEALAGAADPLGMKCDPPREAEAVEATGPSLPSAKDGDCPWKDTPPINLVIVTIQADCEKVTFDAGEGLMAHVEYNVAKDETTIWVGAGVSGGGTVGAVSGKESDTGEDGNILPTKIAPSVTLEGKAGFTFTFKGQSLQDVGFGTEASGSISVAGVSVSGSMSSSVAVEGGLKFDAGSGYALPGSGGGNWNLGGPPR